MIVSKYSGGGGWVEGLHLDTADTGTFDGGDLDVSSISPGSTPGVSDEVVVLSVLGSVSDSGDGVIEVGSAGSGVEDTTGISLEDELVGLDGHGDWGEGDGGLELGNGVGWDVVVRSNVDLAGVLGIFAGSVNSVVGVVSLELLGGLLGVGEGGILPSSIASVGSGIAVNELLLGEGKEISTLDEMSSLDGASSGEGPARSALTLVLDGVDGTSIDPVDGILEVGGVEDLGGLLVSIDLGSEESLVLEVGVGGELVVTNGEGGLGRVDLLDLGGLLGEDVSSELVFLLGSVVETVEGHVVDESGLDLIRDSGFAVSSEVSVSGAKHVHG